VVTIGQNGLASVERVNYLEHQILTSADLRDEQQYLIAMRRRHNIGSHGWGIVRGLNLVVSGASLTVLPGIGVDGYGRELVIPDPVIITIAAIEQLGDNITVWLLYGIEPITSAQGGPSNGDACRSGCQLEQARIRLAPKPPAVTPLPSTFRPDQSPSDDPQSSWPVYLGTISRSGPGAPYSVEQEERPLARLVGESITAASKRTSVQVGNEISGKPERFMVNVGDTSTLSIDRAGSTILYGNAVVGGDIMIADSTDSVYVADFSGPTVPGQTASPWSIYRTSAPGPSGTPVAQLRFEIQSPDGKSDPKGLAFSIGHYQDKAFVPCISVASDCTVTVNGILNIAGQIIQSPIPADPQDPRFGLAVTQTWTAGLTTAATELDVLQSTALQVQINVQSQGPVGQPLQYTVDVSNSGRFTVNHIHTYATLAMDSEIQRRELSPADLILQAGQDHSFNTPVPFTPSQAGRITLAVTAIGVGQIGNTVSAQDTTTVDVQIQSAERPPR
jgi:hypothetical protein